MNCCQVEGLRRVFRGRPVQQEVRAFTRNGLNSRQTAFLAALGVVAGASVLDIGGGIGALALSLLARRLVSRRKLGIWRLVVLER